MEVCAPESNGQHQDRLNSQPHNLLLRSGYQIIRFSCCFVLNSEDVEPSCMLVLTFFGASWKYLFTMILNGYVFVDASDRPVGTQTFRLKTSVRRPALPGRNGELF